MYKIKPRRMLYGHVSTLTYYALVLIYTSSIRLDCFYIQLSSRDIYFISCHLSYLLNIKMQIYIYVLLYVRHSDLIQSNWNKKNTHSCTSYLYQPTLIQTSIPTESQKGNRRDAQCQNANSRYEAEVQTVIIPCIVIVPKQLGKSIEKE